MKLSKTVRYIKLKVYRHRRMLVFGSVAVILGLIMMSKRENNVRFISSDMENTRPQEIWEYVSDFSNMMKLNPTMHRWYQGCMLIPEQSIIVFCCVVIVYYQMALHYMKARKKFIITHESTDYKQWNYTVEYEEHLSQLPFVTNKIIGDFIVDKSQSQHSIKSTHRTCFVKIYCLNTKSEMIFLDLSNGTRIVEKIMYECPRLLTKFCMNEVMYQREEIFGQLRTVFVHTKH